MNTRRLTAANAAACLAFVSLLASGPLAAQSAPKPEANAAPTDPAAPAKLEAFEVTGSRVKRLDYETPAPVVTYTAAAIDGRAQG